MKRKIKLYSILVLFATVSVLYVTDAVESKCEDNRHFFEKTNNEFDSSNTYLVDNVDYDKLLMQKSQKLQEQILQRFGYIVSYNKDTKLPNWVAWNLTTKRLYGPAKRNEVEFTSDVNVPIPRAENSDYYNSGLDRGHMCPAADNKFNMKAMKESFLFTNICPQNSSLNRGDWNEMEITCRKWARKYGSIYIVCGPILYNKRHKTIGNNKVIVPEAFFKVVLRKGKDPEAIGFIYRNIECNNSKNSYVKTIDEIENITGIDFFPSLPDDLENEIEAKANITDW